MPAPPVDQLPERKLEGHEIRDLAVRGVAALGVRTVIIRLMGLAASLVLAHLLTPHDFGLMAFGLAVVGFGAFLTDGGLGSGVLRIEHVRQRQLEAVFGAQLLIGAGAAALIAIIAVPFGTAGAVAAIMAVSLPLDCIKVPSSLAVERRLNYTPIIRAEIAEMLTYNIVAVTTVALGAGIWGVAVAVPCRALTGAVVLTRMSGVLPRPRLHWDELRSLYRFGLNFQGIGLVSFARDQSLNIATTAIAGFSALGTISLVQRLAQPIWLVFDGSWRVAYPAMSRLRDAGHEIASITTRTLRIASTSTGMATVAVASATPALVPSLFGNTWHDVIPIMPVALASLLLGGPIMSCASGFFATIGEPQRILHAEVAGTLVSIATALALLPGLGALGMMIGVLLGTVTSTVVMGRALRPHGVDVFPAIAPATVLSLVSGTAGWLVAQALPPAIWSAAAGTIVGCGLFAVLAWGFQREATRDVLSLGRRMIAGRKAPTTA